MKETGIFAEFKKFITRGNVLDMAVGVIIGGAFTAIINSVVKDIFNPIIGVITGGQDFGALKIVLKPAVGDVAEVAIRYGALINAIVNFLLIALILFAIIKTFNRAKDVKAAKEAEAKAEAAKAAQAAAAAQETKKSAEVLLLEDILKALQAK